MKLDNSFGIIMIVNGDVLYEHKSKLIVLEQFGIYR